MQDTLKRLVATLAKATELEPSQLGFGPPVSEEELARLEAAFPLSLPEELKSLLRFCNGQDGSGPILSEARLQTAQEILDHWESFAENVDVDFFADDEGQDEGQIKASGSTDKWIPFALDWDLGGGIHYNIDLDPGPHGKVGQIIHDVSECDQEVLCGNLTELFEAITACFENGSLSFGYEDDERRLQHDTEYYWETIVRQVSGESGQSVPGSKREEKP